VFASLGYLLVVAFNVDDIKNIILNQKLALPVAFFLACNLFQGRVKTFDRFVFFFEKSTLQVLELDRKIQLINI
jgi:hypothetical protein